MKEPLTDELLKELLDAPSPDSYTSAHKRDLKPRALHEYLQQMLEERDLRRADVIRKANVNATHGWQIFAGERGAGRNTVLALAFAMGLSLTETSRALQAAKCERLYAKCRRDAIIIFCLSHSATLQETNEELYRFGEETIC